MEFESLCIFCVCLIGLALLLLSFVSSLLFDSLRKRVYKELLIYLKRENNPEQGEDKK